MDHVVESFPFNITGAPMYYGSTMSFLGTAILYGKPAGILLTAEVLVVYLIALSYEEYEYHLIRPARVHTDKDINSPFTAEIYAKRDRAQRAGKKVS